MTTQRNEKFKKVVEVAKKIKERKVSGLTLGVSDQEELARVWEEFLSVLPVEERESLGIVTFRFGFVAYKDIPKKIREDWNFFEFIVDVLAG